ncbi:MAG: hypothetical protein ACM3U1_00485 [Chloroflexota bacterium]
MKRPFVIALLILNLIVLLGQVWPEGAPPFARIVNVATLALNLIFLISQFLRKETKNRSGD